MSPFTTTDLERLARGLAIDDSAFLAILADPAAREELARIAQVLELLTPATVDPNSAADFTFTWAELDAYLNGQFPDPRRSVVETYLRKHAPELLGADLTPYPQNSPGLRPLRQSPASAGNTPLPEASQDTPGSN